MSTATKSRSLADVLVEKQILSDEQLAEVTAYLKDHSVAFEQAVMDLGILSDGDLMAIYNDVLQVRFLKLEDIEIDREAVRHIPAAVAHRHHLIPVRRSGNTLAVAMADPAAADALSAMHAVTDFDIIPFVARYDAIEHAVYLHYGECEESGDQAEPAAPVHVQSLIEDDRIGHIGKSIQLHRDQTFESFVECAGNQFPLNVARSIAALQAEEGYNPFHCWGTAGCGKSHILHAIANHLTTHAPLKRYILTTGQQFVDNLFESIRDKKLNFFRYLYRELDVLLIDDAEHLLTREWAQRELLETFRYLQRKGKRMVVASRRNLATEPKVSGELKKALEMGVILGFGPYTDEAKLELARRSTHGVPLAPETLTKIVQCCGDNMSDLLDVLQQITVLAVLEPENLAAGKVDELLRMCLTPPAVSGAERARTLQPLFETNA